MDRRPDSAQWSKNAKTSKTAKSEYNKNIKRLPRTRIWLEAKNISSFRSASMTKDKDKYNESSKNDVSMYTLCRPHKDKDKLHKNPNMCYFFFEKQGVQGYQGYNIPTRSTFCLSTRPDHVMIITAEFNRFYFYLTNLSSILYSCSYMLLHPSHPPLAISALTAANGIFLSFQFTKEP